MFPPEFRFDPVDCPPSVIDEANAAEHRTGEGRFEPVEVAIRRISTDRSPSRDRLESWAKHPDERVLIAFLTSDLSRLSLRETESILLHLLPRAINEARDRGEIWTPVLDALSISIWSAAAWISPLRDAGLDQKDYLETVVVPWIQQQTNPNVLRSVVLRAKSQELIRCIAKTTSVADDALLDVTLEACPSALSRFARNDDLPPEFHELLVDRLVTATVSAKNDPWYVDYFWSALDALTRRGICLRPEQIQHLIDSFEAHVTRLDEFKDVCNCALGLLERHVHNTGDENVAYRMIEMVGKMGDPHWALALLRNSKTPSARFKVTPHFILTVPAHCVSFPEVFVEVAKHAEMRQEPNVRSQLLTSHIPSVLLKLAKDSRPQEFPILFERLAPVDPNAAFNLLERHQAIARHALQPSDLLPLLRASSPEIRSGAITFLAELQNQPKTGAPTAKRRSP